MTEDGQKLLNILNSADWGPNFGWASDIKTRMLWLLIGTGQTVNPQSRYRDDKEVSVYGPFLSVDEILVMFVNYKMNNERPLDSGNRSRHWKMAKCS